MGSSDLANQSAEGIPQRGRVKKIQSTSRIRLPRRYRQDLRLGRVSLTKQASLCIVQHLRCGQADLFLSRRTPEVLAEFQSDSVAEVGTGPQTYTTLWIGRYGEAQVMHQDRRTEHKCLGWREVDIRARNDISQRPKCIQMPDVV